MKLGPLSLFFAALVTLTSCGTFDKERTNTLFTSLPADETGVAFINEVTDTKDFNVFTYRNYYNGGGVAIGDINNDGLADIYFTANMAKNKLYLNKGNWLFEDITEKAGVGGTRSWSTGVTMADVNADGLMDIYVCNSGDVQGGQRENELFINRGDLTFEEKAKEFGLDDAGYSTHASFFDYDLDGDLDCYILNNSFKSIDRVEQFLVKREERDSLGGQKLMRNDEGHFIDVSERAGIYGSWIGFGLGVSVSDLNNDMLPDIYVSNDFWERDYLYINKGDGTFSEEITSRTGTISASSMGSDIADLDNDGNADIFTTDMLPADNLRLKTMARFDETNVKELKVKSSYHYQLMQNALQFNNGDGTFQECASLANTAATDWSWGSLMFDVDNDGWKDIFVSNGIYRDITSMDFSDFVSDRENIKQAVQKNGKFDFNDLLGQITSSKISDYLFVNQRDRTYINLADSLGLGKPSFSNGAAYGDLDNDGDMDLVVNSLNSPSIIYRNNADKLLTNNFLQVHFKGNSKNQLGIGAQVKIFAGGSQQVLQNFTARGFESSVEPILTFGLGNASTLDSLVVVWPDRRKQVLKGVKSNQLITLDQGQADQKFSIDRAEVKPMYEEVSGKILSGNYSHHENEFNDFDVERLLPRKLSTEGPRILKGDLNGDKLDDFMLLGAYGDPDKLFLQTASGQFKEKIIQQLVRDSVYESTCGVFFDPDKDGDLDIMVGSGGNQQKGGAKSHLLRYYQNDGRGNFTKENKKTPLVVGNFSCILAEDFDSDGDPDLFLGARLVPGNYGLIPRSFLLRNDDGNWVDIAPASLGGAGMVTGAVWSDFDGDTRKDLIIAGEWMPIKVYRNLNDKLEGATPLKGTEGLWTAIEKADLNKDGVDEYVLGNWGLNTKLRASADRPLKMYVKDFDQNSKSEFIITWYPPLDTVAYPFASKMDMTGQIPQLKKRSLKYEVYARKTYEELLFADQRLEAREYEVTYLQSAILWNQGNFKLKLEALPMQAQVSPIFGIATGDLDDDSHMDILLGGNFYGLKPEIGRQDSNQGVMLKGDGTGGFTFVPFSQSGIRLKGEVRDIKLLNGTILIGRNNATMLAFRRPRI